MSSYCSKIVIFAAFVSVLSAQTVAVLTGAEGNSTAIPVYSTNPISSLSTASNVPTGAYQLLSLPDGSKSYVLTTSAGIVVVDRNLGNPIRVLPVITGAPTAASISPDGKRLVVIANGQVYLVDTASNAVVGAPRVSGSPSDVAFSIDSQTAFILSSGDFAAFVTAVDTTAAMVTGSTTLPVSGPATGIAMSPAGLLYVSAPYGVFEIEPKSLFARVGSSPTSAATIPLNATPGRLQFTRDSFTGIAINTTPATGDVLVFSLLNKTVTPAYVSNVNGRIDQLAIVSDSRVIAHSSRNVLYELTLSTTSLGQSSIMSALPSGSEVFSFIASRELQSKFLYLTAATGASTMLYKVDLRSNAIASQAPLPDGVTMVALAGTTVPSGAFSVQAVSLYQVSYTGAAPVPLIARVTDASGTPVYNTTVTFTVLCGGLTLSSTTAVTNSSGFAKVDAATGNFGGSFQVQASVPGGTRGGATFTVAVAGAATQQDLCSQELNAGGLFIVGGNGQLISEQQVSKELLLVMAKDAAGNPLPNQQVYFSITYGDGTILCPGVGEQFAYIPTGTCFGTGSGIIAVTDPTGRVGIKFLSTAVLGHSTSQTWINAVSTQDSVNFALTTAIIARANGTQASLPIVDIIAPKAEVVPGFTGARVIRGGAGRLVPGAIKVQVSPADGPESGQAIPNVALNVSPQGDPNTTPSAYCAGGPPLTDATGTATCDLVLGPITGSGLLNVNVGGVIDLPLMAVVVGDATPFTIRILQGDNQSGSPGDRLALRAQIQDPAGNAIPNVPVVWSVIQGAGTLTSVSRETDSRGGLQASLTLGAISGDVVVQATVGTGAVAATATFRISLTPLLTNTTINMVSGSGQTALPGQPFVLPLAVSVVDQNGQPKAGVSVNFGVTSGSAQLGAAVVRTDAQGLAATNVVAGDEGVVLVTASIGNQFTQFVLRSSRNP